MASDDKSGARPAGPVVLRIKLRYDDLATMVARFAPNVGKSGLFLPTKSIQPVGTEVKFELRLANDTPVLVGLGKVKHVRPPDPNNPKAAFGIAIELMRVSREGREVIIKMIERRRAMGLPDVAIPVPEDIDAARRSEIESQPRVETSGVVRDAMRQFASAPVAEEVLTGTPPSGTIAVAKPVAAAQESGPAPIARQDSARASAPLLTSARLGTGPITGQASRSVPVLAPEPARSKRPRVAELIAKATELSGPLASVAIPGLDEHVDVERALQRARALAAAAGGDLDAELASVRDAAAAPVEIDVEAASAELARQLGGAAISKRDRSARWAPPPAIEAREPARSEPAREFATKTRAVTEAAPSSPIAAVTAVERERDREPEQLEQVAPVAYEIRPSAPAYNEVRDYQAEPAGEEDTAFRENASTITAVDPEILDASPRPMMIADDVDPESFEGLEDHGESTQIGAIPVDPNAFGGHGYPTTPDGFHDLEDQIDRQLAAAEAAENSDFAVAIQQPPQNYDPYGDRSTSDARSAQAEPEPEDEEEEIAEISDFDVLAEADEEDADLLSAHGEQDASGSDDAAPEAVPEPQPQYDFAAQLDLGDEPSSPELPRRARGISSHDFPDPPSSSYTFAEAYPPEAPLHFEPQVGEEFDEPHSYSQQAPTYQQEPQYLRQSPNQYEDPGYEPPQAYERPAEYAEGPARHHAQQYPAAEPPSDDLEDALAALDVDLDPAVAEQRKQRRRSTSQQRPLPGIAPMSAPARTARPLPGMPEPRASDSAPVRTLAHTVPRAKTKPPTMPPPVPAAAFRKPPTQQVPLAQPPGRASTEDGILIDFDDDE